MPFRICAFCGSIERLAWAKASGGPWDSALFTAVALDQQAVVVALLGAGVEADQLGVYNSVGSEANMTALCLAAQRGNAAAVFALLGAGAEVDRASYNGITPLLAAVEFGTEDVVAALLEAGARVNQVNQVNGRGCTPLMMAVAAQSSRTTMVMALLEAGARVNKAVIGGLTALTI